MTSDNIGQLGWYTVEKSYRGGSTIYAIEINQRIKDRFVKWDALMEYIGEHTAGGGESGYKVFRGTAFAGTTKPKADKTLEFKIITQEVLVGGRPYE